MKLYPDSASYQLEFDKVKVLVGNYCETEYALNKAVNLRHHTVHDYITTELQQTQEYKLLSAHGINFPNDFTTSVQKELKLLSIEGSQLSGEQFILVRRLSENIERIFRWFNNERRLAYNGLEKVIDGIFYEKKIIEIIDEVLDETGNVKDNASPELQKIRLSLFRKRNELRSVFEKVIARLTKQVILQKLKKALATADG